MNRAYQVNTQFRWVNGMAQLADALTKIGAKVLLQWYSQRQFWRLIHDDKFISGRKIHKRALMKELESHHVNFLYLVKKLAHESGYPWDEAEDFTAFEPLS